MFSTVTIQNIKEVIEKALEAIKESREEISDIVVRAEEQYDTLKQIHMDLVKEIENISESIDKCIIKYKKSREELAKVNKEFDKYKEEDKIKAYRKADNLRIKLLMLQQDEKKLIQRRNETEIKVKSAYKTYEKAKLFASNIDSIFLTLSNNLKNIDGQVDELVSQNKSLADMIKIREEERNNFLKKLDSLLKNGYNKLLKQIDLCYKLVEIEKNKTKIEITRLKNIVRSFYTDLKKHENSFCSYSCKDFVSSLEELITNIEYIKNCSVKLNSIKNKDTIEDLDIIFKICVIRLLYKLLCNITQQSSIRSVDLNIEASKTRFNILLNLEGKLDINDISFIKKEMGIEFFLWEHDFNVNKSRNRIYISVKMN